MKKLIIGAGHCGQGLAKIFGAKGEAYRLIHHTDNWESLVSDSSMIINCAGIVGRKKAEAVSYTELMDANIHLPMKIAERATTWGIPCILISTGAVYAKPSGTLKVESDAREPTNAYTESKILMENNCKHTDATIFRLTNLCGDGEHPNDYENGIERWKYVVSTYVSTLNINRFATVLSAIPENREAFKGQIFNIAEPRLIYLPALCPEKPLIEKEEQPDTATVSHILDISKLWKIIKF